MTFCEHEVGREVDRHLPGTVCMDRRRPRRWRGRRLQRDLGCAILKRLPPEVAAEQMTLLEAGKDKDVKTFDELKARLAQDFVELKHVQGMLPATVRSRHLKEQEIGRHCYQAEEDLTKVDLDTLKQMLGIDDTQWRRYKTKCIEGSSPGGRG